MLGKVGRGGVHTAPHAGHSFLCRRLARLRSLGARRRLPTAVSTWPEAEAPSSSAIVSSGTLAGRRICAPGQ